MLTAVLHEALTPGGKYGGWFRNRAYGRHFMVVWGQPDEAGDRLNVVLEFGPRRSRWAILRILQRIEGSMVCLVEAKVSCLDHALGILQTYGIVNPVKLPAYRRAYAEGYRTAEIVLGGRLAPVR